MEAVNQKMELLHVLLCKVKNDALKSVCISLHLARSGTKAEMMNRIVEYLLALAQRAVQAGSHDRHGYVTTLNRIQAVLVENGTARGIIHTLQQRYVEPSEIGNFTLNEWRSYIVTRYSKLQFLLPQNCASHASGHLAASSSSSSSIQARQQQHRNSILTRACTVCKRAVEEFYPRNAVSCGSVCCFACRCAVLDPFFQISRMIVPPKILQRTGPMGATRYEEEFHLMASDVDQVKNGTSRVIVSTFLVNSQVKDGFQWPHRSHFYYNEESVLVRQKWDPNNHNQCEPFLRERPAVIPKFICTVGRNHVRIATHGSSPLVLAAYLAVEQSIPDLIEATRLSALSTSFDGKQFIVDFFRRTSQDGIETMSVNLSLNCPLSVGRLQLPARGKDCVHIGCFDLQTYILFSRDATSRAWCCPICHAFTPYHSLYIDPYIQHILVQVADTEEMDQVEVFPDAEWKRKEPVKQPNNNGGDGTADNMKRSLDQDDDLIQMPKSKRVEIDLTLSSDEEGGENENEANNNRRCCSLGPAISPPLEVLNCDLPPPRLSNPPSCAIINLFESDDETSGGGF